MLRVLYVICFLLCGFTSYAGLDTSSYYHFNLKTGLPTNYVYSVIQDKVGYTWFATDNGLVRYNGYDFDVYNTENGGLPANDVVEMYEDHRGRIWIRTFSYDFGYVENGKYSRIYVKNGKIATATYLFDYGGLVYFSDLNYPVRRLFVVDDNMIKAFSFSESYFSELKDDQILDVTPAANLEINIWTTNLNLYKWNLLHNKLVLIGKFPEAFRFVPVHRMMISPAGKYYMYKLGADELHYFDKQTLEYKKKVLSEWGADATEKSVCLSPGFIKNNLIGNSGVITNTHTYTFSDDLELINRQRNSDIIPSNLQLLCRFKDKRDVSWYTTKNDGVWVKPPTYNFFVSREKNEILDKSTYIGTVDKISFWWDNINSELYEVEKRRIINRINFKKGIEVKNVSGNDTVIYITTSDGFYRYYRNSGKLINLNDIYEVSPDIKGVNYAESASNTKMVLQGFRKIKLIDNHLYSLNYGGLYKFFFDGKKINAKQFEKERFTDIFFDRANRLLYAYSNQMIMILNIDTDHYDLVRLEDLRKFNIRNTRNLEKDQFGNVLLLDDNSLFICDERLNSVKKIETKISLQGSIFRLSGNRLFIAGKFGIGYADIEGLGKIGKFSIIPNSGTHHYSKVEDFVISEDGYGMLNADEEWMSFSLDSLVKYAIPIDKQNGFFTIITHSPAKKAISSNDTLCLNQSESILKLNVVNYSGKGTVKYTYRISGSENEKWQTSTSGEIFLTNLSAGEFHTIECSVKDDLWESDTLKFYIYRYPKWYQTSTWKTIFWVSGVLLFIGLVLITMLITRYYVAKKNERKRALTELELKAIHSQINPHFIFNTLSAALFYINKKRFDDAYTHVNKFSQLLRSYLKSSQDRYVMLDEEIKMLRNYIELQQIRFEEKFKYQIEIDNKLPTNNIRIPSLLLQPLVENAINHGLFHKEKGGILLLKFEQGNDNTELVCTIEDNGVGRAESKKINDASSTKDSYGTKLTNQLLEVFKLYENLDIKLKYFDKELPETGTIVILTLKNVNYVA